MCCRLSKFVFPIPQTESFVGNFLFLHLPQHARPLAHSHQSRPTPLSDTPHYGTMIAIRNFSSNSQSVVVDISLGRSGSPSPPFLCDRLLTVGFWSRMRQSIRYIPRPGDPSTLLPLHTLARTPRNLPSPWTENRSPKVVVRGVIFGRREVEVECRVSNR